MSSLQSALPNEQFPSSFLGGATQSWFSQDPVAPFIPSASQGKCLNTGLLLLVMCLFHGNTKDFIRQ